MEGRIYAKDVSQNVGHDITLAGFAQTIRDQGKIIFIVLRDTTGIVQCVVLNHNKKAFSVAKNLTQESVIKVTGLAKKEKQAPGGFEIEVKELEILSKANPELPIPIIAEKGADKTNQPTRLDWRWLDLRKPEKKKIFQIWTSAEKGLREYFYKNAYIEFHAPSLLGTPSEGGAEVFEVPYFGKKAYLAQSPQLYKQMALAAGFDKVFTIGPVFRAEPSFTTRHLTEFTGWDFEVSYINDHFEVMNILEEMLISSFKKIKGEQLPDLEIPKRPFPKLTMEEAKENLKKAGVKSEKKHDVSPEEERAICEIIKRDTGHDFVFLTDWQIDTRPFYHMRYKNNPQITKSFDLLYKGIEITTGAQREHRVEVLEKQAKEKGLNIASLKDYLNFFRYGCPPHGGGGIGPARIIMKMLGLQNVNEATFLPRNVRRLTP